MESGLCLLGLLFKQIEVLFGKALIFGGFLSSWGGGEEGGFNLASELKNLL